MMHKAGFIFKAGFILLEMIGTFTFAAVVAAAANAECLMTLQRAGCDLLSQEYELCTANLERSYCKRTRLVHDVSESNFYSHPTTAAVAAEL